MQMRSSNQVHLSGSITAGFLQRQDESGRKIYIGDMDVFRKSGVFDILPIMVTKSMSRAGTDHICSVYGEMRSRRIKVDGKKITLNYIRALKIEYLDRLESEDANEVFLTGELKVDPIVKKVDEKTGEWKLAKIVLMVRRPKRYSGHRKADCISCLVWNENAEAVRNLKTGQGLKIEGRFQSRERWSTERKEYIKGVLNVSVKKLEVL